MGCGASKDGKAAPAPLSVPNVSNRDLDMTNVQSDNDLLDYDQTGEAKLKKLSKEEFDKLIEDALADPKTKHLDANTKLFRKLVSAVAEANAKDVKTIEQICQPKDKKKLDYFELDGVFGMKVPDDDEDWPDQSFVAKRFSGMAQGTLIEMLKRLPCDDTPSFFDSCEEGIVLGQLAMEGVLPKASERFPDLTSDQAMSLIAFWGIGQLFLEGNPPKEAGGKPAGFDVDLSYLDGLPCRAGFEGYGAKAHFDENYNIESIYSCHDKKLYKPGETGWEHAKWGWKASLGAGTTAVTHLVQLHWIVVNATHVACRTELSALHPVRRALKVFLYNTGGVNFGSTMSLYPKDSFLHRMSALEYDGLLTAINYGDSSFKYQTHPDFCKSKNLGADLESKIPMVRDGVKVWNVYIKFFTSYMDLYFKDDAAVTGDAEIVAYWKCIDSRGGHGSPYPYGLPPLTKAALIDQMTHHAFWSTCWHEFVGALVHYLTTPDGLATKVVPGKELMDCQTFIQGLCLIALTGTRQPQIMSDWKHLLPDEAKPLHDVLLADFNVLADEIEALNKTTNAEGDVQKPPTNPNRMRAANSFNPRTFECSVSV